MQHAAAADSLTAQKSCILFRAFIQHWPLAHHDFKNSSLWI
jgi:hypothetical protein